jgi:methylthioribose-1-phosphate isomerase
MQVDGKDFRTIWLNADGAGVDVIDQTRLPHRFEVLTLRTAAEAADAIKRMVVRGAPLIGATAAYGMALAAAEDPSDSGLARAFALLAKSRPTAVNLRWALERMRARLTALPAAERAAAAYREAALIADEDVEVCSAIGSHGAALIEDAAERRSAGLPVNVLTHCNAGWLATVDWGTALAPIFKAHRAGVPVHVWVDETRPRNQGASLTAWELNKEGVPHTIIADNTGGHLMQHGMVDLCIVGTDRTTRAGDVANKIGTYLKALAAHDNRVPFYVALPSSTIDWRVKDGVKEIPIEQRGAEEVTHLTGATAAGGIETIRISPEGSPAANYAFDVTPARLVTGLITERGICDASEAGLRKLFPEEAEAA